MYRVYKPIFLASNQSEINNYASIIMFQCYMVGQQTNDILFNCYTVNLEYILSGYFVECCCWHRVEIVTYRYCSFWTGGLGRCRVVAGVPSKWQPHLNIFIYLVTNKLTGSVGGKGGCVGGGSGVKLERGEGIVIVRQQRRYFQYKISITYHSKWRVVLQICLKYIFPLRTR